MLVEVADPIRSDLRRFLELVEGDETLDPKSFGVVLSRGEGIALLRSAYLAI